MDNITGTSGNDTISGLSAASTAATTDTLTITDVINGGAGTDTLNIAVSATNTDVTHGALISNVETIQVRNVAATGTVATYAAGTGVTTIASNLATGDLTATGLAAGGAYGVIGDGSVVNGILLAGYAAAATAGILNISGGTTAGAVTMSGTGLTSQTVNSTGATNVIGAFAGAASVTSTTINATTGLTTGAATNLGATVTVTGAGAVSFGATALQAGVTTLNASANTGGLTVALGTLVTQTVTGSAGNDVITSGAVLTTGSVNAGAGTDTLVIGANVGHVNTTALAAKYTGFETLRLAGTLDMSLISGITAVQLTNASVLTNMTATQAAAVQIRSTAVDGTGDAQNFGLAAATGTADVLSLTMGTGLTNTSATDIAALTVTGFETLNITTASGPTSTAGAGGANDRTTSVGAITGATLRAINLTGTAVNLTNIATTVAVTIDGSALTGDGAATPIGLTVAGSAVAGSTITGSAVRDAFTIGAEGSAYNAGAGGDRITATVALLVADGTTDGTIDGGTGTDMITLTDTTTTLTDNHFTKLSNMETLTLSNTVGDASITTGAAFNSAFASGATITTGVMAATKDVTLAAGLSTVAVNLTIDATDLVGTATETHSIVTGSAADTVTFTGDATYVGVNAAAQGTIVISTGAGADTISVTVGTLLASTGGQFLTVTGGTGADLITKVGTNSTTVTSTAVFTMASGDSGTTTATYDQITGFDVADGTNLSDVLNFAGTGAVGTLATSTDFGTILSHTITAGVAQFSTAAVYATATVINATNLADVVGYLAANTATLDAIAFAYDNNGDGANDSTLVFSNQAADSLVLLVGVTGVASLNATLTTTTANCVAIA